MISRLLVGLFLVSVCIVATAAGTVDAIVMYGKPIALLVDKQHIIDDRYTRIFTVAEYALILENLVKNKREARFRAKTYKEA